MYRRRLLCSLTSFVPVSPPSLPLPYPPACMPAGCLLVSSQFCQAEVIFRTRNRDYAGTSDVVNIRFQVSGTWTEYQRVFSGNVNINRGSTRTRTFALEGTPTNVQLQKIGDDRWQYNRFAINNIELALSGGWDDLVGGNNNAVTANSYAIPETAQATFSGCTQSPMPSPTTPPPTPPPTRRPTNPSVLDPTVPPITSLTHP